VSAEVTKLDLLLTYRDIKMLTSAITYATSAIQSSSVMNPPSESKNDGQHQFAIIMMDVKPEPSEEEKQEEERTQTPPLMPFSADKDEDEAEGAEKNASKKEKALNEKESVAPVFVLPPQPKAESMVAKIGDFSFVVVNNMGKSNFPLFRLLIKGTDLVVKNWSSSVSLFF
jgi:hypothetical protein